MKNRSVTYLSLLMLSLLPLVSFSAKSLTFGEPGVETNSKVHIYIDSDDPAPKCGPNCVRYSVLVDDRGAIGGTSIEKVIVLTEHTAGVATLNLTSPVLYPKTLWRHMTSPGKTEQVVVSLPMAKDSKVEDLNFHLLALKRRCFNPTMKECDELVIDVQGQFTGKNLKSLKPIEVQKLLKDK